MKTIISGATTDFNHLSSSLPTEKMSANPSMKNFDGSCHALKTIKSVDKCPNTCNLGQNESISNQYHQLLLEKTLYLPDILWKIFGLLEPKDIRSAAQFVLF